MLTVKDALGLMAVADQAAPQGLHVAGCTCKCGLPAFAQIPADTNNNLFRFIYRFYKIFFPHTKLLPLEGHKYHVISEAVHFSDRTEHNSFSAFHIVTPLIPKLCILFSYMIHLLMDSVQVQYYYRSQRITIFLCTINVRAWKCQC